MPEKEFQHFFDFIQLFKRFSKIEIEIIAQNIWFRKVDSNVILLNEGKVARELFFICKGILKISTTNERGNSVVQFFLKENQFCTILYSLQDNLPSNENIITAIECELIILPKDKLLYLFQRIPHFKDLLDTITRQTLLDKIAIKNAYAGQDATSRYQTFLLRQSDIALRVPLSDVASFLGITQQSLSRIRKNISS